MFFKKLTAIILAIILCCGFFSVNAAELQNNAPPAKIPINSCEIQHKQTLTYNGKKIKPGVTVLYKGQKLKKNKDYTVSYKNNKNYGKASIVVKGINAYKGTKTGKFNIAPKKVQLKSLKSDFTMRAKVTWKKSSKADGYRLEYSTNKDFKDFQYKTIKDNKTLTKTIRGLKAGKKYYFRIRSFKTTKDGRIYSHYSEVKTVKIKNPASKTSKKNIICLTFDDGPSAVTEEVLDILKRNNVKATFFIVNYSDSEKPLVKRMIDEGHTLAIHNYSHNYGKIYKSVDTYMDYHNKIYKKIKKDFGYKAKFSRFPGGTSNTVSRNYNHGIMRKLAKKITKKGFTYFDWNIDSGDASGYCVSKNTIKKNVINGLYKNRTNVVLLHDSGGKGTTADALQSIIDYGNNNGYVFEKITEKTSKIQHKPNN